jgi:hypothetical protein
MGTVYTHSNDQMKVQPHLSSARVQIDSLLTSTSCHCSRYWEHGSRDGRGRRTRPQHTSDASRVNRRNCIGLQIELAHQERVSMAVRLSLPPQLRCNRGQHAINHWLDVHALGLLLLQCRHERLRLFRRCGQKQSLLGIATSSQLAAQCVSLSGLHRRDRGCRWAGDSQYTFSIYHASALTELPSQAQKQAQAVVLVPVGWRQSTHT